MNAEGTIEIRNVCKDFVSTDGRAIRVLQNVAFTIKSSEFVLFLGPSGCGKSTLLNMLAGFELPTAGELLLSGRKLDGPDAHRSVVFQDVQGSLFPWLTVQHNVEFGLKMAGVPARMRSERARHFLMLVGLEEFGSKMPFELSGGMKQRVQIARALAIDPEILLMDEPFGALDAQSRSALQEELEIIWQQTKKTIIFVTHDILEALKLADRIVVFSQGPAAHVVSIVSVPLPRPRSTTSAAFCELNEHIESLLYNPYRIRGRERLSGST